MIEVRLECLRLAIESNVSGCPLSRAQQFLEFVTGKKSADLSDSDVAQKTYNRIMAGRCAWDPD